MQLLLVFHSSKTLRYKRLHFLILEFYTNVGTGALLLSKQFPQKFKHSEAQSSLIR